ncbi:GDSL-type esterase/lipase family protein [Streptomyces sp. NPDC055607]
MVIATGAVLGAAGSTANASPLPSVVTAIPHPGAPVIVSMGDSFMAGTAGRWSGNSLDPFGNRNWTDRAYVNGRYEPQRVYGDSGTCYRSDTAEVHSAGITYKGVLEKTINLACSGATTKNIWRGAAGGQPYKGQLPQADVLNQVVQTNNVKTIVLSIGGNDVGFGDIIAACVVAYKIPLTDFCRNSQQPILNSKIDQAMANVDKTIKEIQAVMEYNGYRRNDAINSYRLVVQSYPSPVPRAREMRYPQNGTARTLAGCPLTDPDLDWARDSLVPQLSGRISQVAKANGVDFIDLSDALQGHETCSTFTQLASAQQAPYSSRFDWARYLSPGVLQGDLEESFHPNAYGQRALGNCLKKWSLKALTLPEGGSYKCSGWSNIRDDQMTFQTKN